MQWWQRGSAGVAGSVRRQGRRPALSMARAGRRSRCDVGEAFGWRRLSGGGDGGWRGDGSWAEVMRNREISHPLPLSRTVIIATRSNYVFCVRNEIDDLVLRLR